MTILRGCLSAVILFAGALLSAAQTSEFTYQGKLTDGSFAANSNYDMLFLLRINPAGNEQVGGSIEVDGVSVVNGTFTVNLDFGSTAFTGGGDRYLQILVRRSSDPPGTPFTNLTPRQHLTSAPYAARSSSSATADLATNSTQLGGVAASQYVVTTDTRLSDSRTPLAGSTNYVQNTTTPQSANFNIVGTGTAGTLDATGFFSLNGSRILSAPGTSNLFAGVGSGTQGTSSSFFGAGAGAANNSAGANNSFFGANAGTSNQTGTSNSFFGFESGKNTTSSFGNSFFGDSSGHNNGSDNNSFFGASAGFGNSAGTENSFFGASSGQASNANGNSFFGYQSGITNQLGANNSFFGWHAGFSNVGGSLNALFGSNAGNGTTGSSNTFIGANSGGGSGSGNNNTVLGSSANIVGGGGISFATAIGSGATVNTPNTIVVGRSLDKTIVAGTFRIRSISAVVSTSTLCIDGNGDVGLCSLPGPLAEPTTQVLRDKLDAQQRQIEAQQRQIEALKALICGHNVRADVCKANEP